MLSRKLRVSHIFKLREGCGFGFNRKSISVAYAFLNNIGCKYLLADAEIHFDWHLFDRLRERQWPSAFAVREVCDVGQLSGFDVKLFEVVPKNVTSTDAEVESALRALGGQNQERPRP